MINTLKIFKAVCDSYKLLLIVSFIHHSCPPPVLLPVPELELRRAGAVQRVQRRGEAAEGVEVAGEVDEAPGHHLHHGDVRHDARAGEVPEVDNGIALGPGLFNIFEKIIKYF